MNEWFVVVRLSTLRSRLKFWKIPHDFEISLKQLNANYSSKNEFHASGKDLTNNFLSNIS